MNTEKIDFEHLNQLLLEQCPSLLENWLPGGRVLGGHYRCSNINGGNGKSMGINLKTGMWSDFALESCSGKDLISLYAAKKSIKQIEAARELSSAANNPIPKVPSKPFRKYLKSRGPEEIPSLTHKDWGKPTAIWTYRDENGFLISLIARYETKGGKQCRPWIKQNNKWIMKAPPSPRSLFGLEQLAKYPARPVLIVEGEKACESARKIVGDAFTCITWMFGCKSWRKTDWTPVYGREILIWPDADEQGRTAALNIGEMLVQNGS